MNTLTTIKVIRVRVGSGSDHYRHAHVTVRLQRDGDRKVAHVQLVHAAPATRGPRGDRAYKEPYPAQYTQVLLMAL